MRRHAAVMGIALAALYLTIWPHEVGHSFAAYAFGCKANWWRTDTTWYLFNSWGGAIDYECLRARGRFALGATDFAGIGVNLWLLGVAPLVGTWWRRDLSTPAKWRFIATFVWALANYAEAFSYLVLNTAWLKSDMVAVVETSGVNRWVWCAAGTAAGALIGFALRGPARRAAALLASPRTSERRWVRRSVVFVLAVSLLMAGARIHYT